MYTLTDFGDYTRRVYPGVYTPAVGFSRTCVYIVGKKSPIRCGLAGIFYISLNVLGTRVISRYKSD